MHAVHPFSIEAGRHLPLFVLLLQGQHRWLFGGAAVELAARQHGEIELAKGDHRKTLDLDTMPSSPSMALKNDSNPTIATLSTHHHIANAVSAPSPHVDAQALTHPKAQVLASVSSASEASEAHSTETPMQASSGRGRFAGDSIAQRGDSSLQRVMRSESLRRGTGVARDAMAQRRHSKVQSLMRSADSRRGKEVPERKIRLWPMQVFNDGHMSVLQVEKGGAPAGFDSYPSGSAGKQAFIVDQNGHAAPDLDIAQRRDESVLDKGAARGSMAQRGDSTVQRLMRSDHSKRGKEVHERKTITSPVQVSNDGHMPSFPYENARATTGVDSHPSGSIGKQPFIVDQIGHLGPELDIARRRGENVFGKTQKGLAKQRVFASDDVVAERASAVPSPVTQEPEKGSSHFMSFIVIALLLVVILLLLDVSRVRRRQRQETAAGLRNLRPPRFPLGVMSAPLSPQNSRKSGRPYRVESSDGSPGPAR